MAVPVQKAPPASGGALGDRVDPLRAYNWKIQIDRVDVGQFIQCSGLEISVDPISYTCGGDHVERKLPGQVHYHSVTLEQGLTDSTLLWDWMQSYAFDKDIQYKNVSILMLSPDGDQERLRWSLNDAWPSAWRAAPLNSANSLVAIHSITLEYRDLDKSSKLS